MLTRGERYVASTLLGAIAMVMMVLLALGGLFQFIGEQGSIGVGRYGIREALAYSLLNLPRFALESLPAGTLIGAMLGIGNLARTHEITALRAAGMSKLRLALAAAVAGMVIVALALAAGEYVAPRFEQVAEQRKAFAKYDNISFAGSGGAWLRDGDTIVNVSTQSSAAEFTGMVIYRFDAGRRLSAIGRAERATATAGGDWQLHEYSETRFDDARVSASREPVRSFAGGVSAEFLRLAAVLPGQMSLAALRTAIEHSRSNGQSDATYRFAFWSRIATTVALLVGVLFAVPFGFGLLRAAGSGARLTIGLVVGVLFFFLQRVVQSGVVVFAFSPLLVAWLPVALLAMAGGVLLWRAR